MNLTNPYYAEQIKKRGVKISNLQVVKNFFHPCNADIDKIVNAISDCKTVIDVGSGYGLLINRLARKTPEIQYTGIDTMYWDKEFELPHAEKNVVFEFDGIRSDDTRRYLGQKN